MAATTRKAAPTRARASKRTSTAKQAESKDSFAVRLLAAARVLLASRRTVRVLVVASLAVAALAFVTWIALTAAERTVATSEVSSPSADDGTQPEAASADATPGARASNLAAEIAALQSASCIGFDDLIAGHEEALQLPPDERLDALAVLAVGVPLDAGALTSGFEHQRAAIDHDLAAAAWTLAGEHAEAARSSRLAGGEALQARAYAAAVCGR